MGQAQKMIETQSSLDRSKYLRGVDLSKHNAKFSYYGDYDFVIAKATEGKTYTDPYWTHHITNALEYGCYIGAYHYARPDNNKPVDEVLNFINAIAPYYKSGMLLVLDWEGDAWNYPIDWAIEWLTKVKEWCGITPIFYASASRLVGDVEKIAKAGFPLWSADYSSNAVDNTRKGCFDDWLLRQYCSYPYDKDIFNGGENKWKEVTKQVDSIVTTEPPKQTEPTNDEFVADIPKECECCFCTALRSAGWKLNEAELDTLAEQ